MLGSPIQLDFSCCVKSRFWAEFLSKHINSAEIFHLQIEMRLVLICIWRMEEEKGEAMEKKQPRSTTWFRHLWAVVLHVWHNHKLWGTLLVAVLSLFSAPIWLVSGVVTFFLYLGHAHTAHTHGTRIWKHRGCLKWIVLLMFTPFILAVVMLLVLVVMSIVTSLH